MMQLRTPDAARMLAEMRARHAIALCLDGAAAAAVAAPPTVSSAFACQPKGGAGGQAPFDYAAWAADLAALVGATPRSTSELAQHYGLDPRSLHGRLGKARRLGCWPPAGMRQGWTRDSYAARRMTVERVGETTGS